MFFQLLSFTLSIALVDSSNAQSNKNEDSPYFEELMKTSPKDSQRKAEIRRKAEKASQNEINKLAAEEDSFRRAQKERLKRERPKPPPANDGPGEKISDQATQTTALDNKTKNIKRAMPSAPAPAARLNLKEEDLPQEMHFPASTPKR